MTQHGNDKKELEPIVNSVSSEVREVSDVSADSGFYSEEAIAAVEKENEEGKLEGPEVYCAVEKGKHGRTLDDLKKKPQVDSAPEKINAKENEKGKLEDSEVICSNGKVQDGMAVDELKEQPPQDSLPENIRAKEEEGKREYGEVICSDEKGQDGIAVDDLKEPPPMNILPENINAKEEGKREYGEVICSNEKGQDGIALDDLKEQPPQDSPPEKISAKEKMARKLKSEEGKKIYKKRKETVEPVFGIIKQAMGFRQFMLRGLEKVNTEWSLVKVAYNFKQLHNLLGRRSLSECMSCG